MFKKILVAHDGSEHARRAFSAAVGLAQCWHSELHMICVEEHLPHYAATVGEVQEEKGEEDTYFQSLAKEAKAEAMAAKVVLHVVITPGHEVETVVKYATDHNFDLLVIGFMGHSRVLGRIMGGSAANLTRLAPCTVLVVK